MKPNPLQRSRVVIETITPAVDGGRYAIKRTIGEIVSVEADIFADGHDMIAASLLYRHNADTSWRETPMKFFDNDRWQASFSIDRVGSYSFTIKAWIDHFLTWRRDLEKKAKAGQDVSLDLRSGHELVTSALEQAPDEERGGIKAWLDKWSDPAKPQAERVALALDSFFGERVHLHSDRSLATRYPHEFVVIADPVRARYGAWYELFPRSCNSDGKRHGSLKDVETQLPRLADMGFDVLYLPPIHPIGEAFRKGRNNNPEAQPGDVGSPWAIGGKEGGHKAVHPELGSVDDVRRLVEKAKAVNIEIALDIAFQCSPDHPYVREHAEWFKKRPDGTIQYAENPPKKYQDIYPFDFESPEADGLWQELRSVFEFWIHHGINIFRVDNPHTKGFPFWEWVIGELKRAHPETIFLSEAFTRPKVMYGLAKAGFTQSYNYFPWRNTGPELRQFMTELTRTNVREFYRPNLWPNTPDILPQFLQYGGRAGFMIRFVLAATLGASYGIYGPAFELCEDRPRAPGEEEYLDSEKYELKSWNLNAPQSIEPLIKQVNAIRRANLALHSNDLLAFHSTENEQLLAYSKRTADRSNQILIVVNLDPHHRQAGVTELNLEEFGIGPKDTFQAHDLLSNAHYLWRGPRNSIELDPKQLPAAIYHIRRHVRTENDFDYFM
ncbi:MAG TPA: alpha-1,4-glucan--maltose-1-phosphate maltosyltransferase [Opitutaceae bacterium]|nr:alpha-1,4-glucan--maltose-1-phosphate maltosyltransferase [Opitutaceae bacterium]